MLAHAVLHLTSLPELQRLGKSTGVNLSVKERKKKKKKIKDNAKAQDDAPILCSYTTPLHMTEQFLFGVHTRSYGR